MTNNKYSKYLYNSNEVTIQEAQVTLNGATLLYRGGILTFSGLPKSRKSTYMMGLLEAICFQNNRFNFVADVGNVLLIDTEQTQTDFYKSSYRLRSLQLYNDVNMLDIYLFRELSSTDIIESLEYLLNLKKYNYLFIDSITDCIANFNDVSLAYGLIQKLKYLTSKFNISIITVIHLGKTNLQSLGALGSAIDRASQSLLVVEKDEADVSWLKPKMLRSSKNFEPVGIFFDYETKNYQLIHDTEDLSTEAQKFDIKKLEPIQIKAWLSLIFKESPALSYGDIVECVKANTHRGTNYVKLTIVKHLIKYGYIVKSNNGNYEIQK